MEINADKIIRVEEYSDKQANVVDFCGIMITLVHTNHANLALLEPQGYRIAMLSGALKVGTSLQVDVLLSGSTAPGTIKPEKVITAKPYDWQGFYQNTTFYYTPQGGTIQIRPGKAVRFKGVEYVTQRTKTTDCT